MRPARAAAPLHPPAPPAGEFETIPADLVLKSIGFKSVGIAGVAFDERRGVVPNKLGQVGRSLASAAHHGSWRAGNQLEAGLRTYWPPAGSMSLPRCRLRFRAAQERMRAALRSPVLPCHRQRCSLPPAAGVCRGRRGL